MDSNKNFIALDLETSGLDSSTEEIIEIGLVRFENGKVVNEFSKTVNPGKSVSDNVLMLTGLKQKKLDRSPTIQELIPEIKDFIREEPLVGHNISFDTDFLKSHLPLPNITYDTLRLSQIYLPFASSHKLAYLAEYLTIPYKDAHRALNDAKMCGRIFLKIYQIMTNLSPELLKRQLEVIEGKFPESDLIKSALENSLKKGLNRKPYPFEIPVNFRENKKEEEGKELSSIKEYFDYKGLEKRPSQLKMAELVYSSLNNDEFLLVEASAGTGKSLAYLIPAIIIAKESGEPIYISCYTKNLQQQVFTHDIPFGEEITGFGVNTLLRKGRSNYLCLLKFRELPKSLNPIFLSALYLWGYLTRTGDLSEISYLFREINSGLLSMDESCRKESCPYYSSCFYYNMMKKVKNADLILVNHALFFTGNPNSKRVIFDEAHELEKAATSGFSLTISFGELQAVLNNIKKELKRKKNKLYKNIKKIIDEAKKSFENVGKSIVSSNEYSVGFYKDEQLLPLRSLTEHLEDLINILSSPELEEDQTVDRLQEVISKLKIIIEQKEKERVFYYKFPNRNRPLSLELIAAPLNVDSYLEEYLYPNMDSFIMTSATLTVGESFDFVKYILGLTRLNKRLKEISLPDTYNFREQALTIVPTYLSNPVDSSYIEHVSQFIKDIILPEKRGTLVLFTSYDHMKGVYQKIHCDFEEVGRELLIQGFGKSRSKLLSLFKENEGSVLLATGSFWQGIDVPGKPLEIVIIEKLPFPNPSDPLIGAKSSYFENKGLGGFSSYTLPLSVLRFKQGFGRLIRSTRDMGVVFILDKRVVNKWYGSIFLESLPTETSLVRSSLEAKEALNAWFEEGRVYRALSLDEDWEQF